MSASLLPCVCFPHVILIWCQVTSCSCLKLGLWLHLPEPLLILCPTKLLPHEAALPSLLCLAEHAIRCHLATLVLCPFPAHPAFQLWNYSVTLVSPFAYSVLSSDFYMVRPLDCEALGCEVCPKSVAETKVACPRNTISSLGRG